MTRNKCSGFLIHYLFHEIFYNFCDYTQRSLQQPMTDEHGNDIFVTFAKDEKNVNTNFSLNEYVSNKCY